VRTHNDENNDNLIKMKADLIKRFSDVKHKATNEELDQALIRQMDKVTERNKRESFTDIVKEQLEMQEAKWNGVVNKWVDESLNRAVDNIQEIRSSVQETRTQVAEERDKERRRNNIVLYKVPESNAVRAEERHKADIDFCLLLFNNCLNVGITEDDLLHVFRLGRRGDTNAPRPTSDGPIRKLQLQEYNYGVFV